MPSFAIQTVKHPALDQWAGDTRTRFKEQVYLNGALRSLGSGLYVFHIEPVIPRIVGNAIAFLIMAGASIAHIVGLSGVSCTGYIIGALVAMGWNALWSPICYRLLMRIQMRRVMGCWVPVKDATTEVVRRVAHGTV